MRRNNKLYVVIHVADADQAIRNAKIAFANGADGIFLINHGPVTPAELRDVYQEVRKNFPGAWIGLNFLGINLSRDLPALMPSDAQALWCDSVDYVEGLGKEVAIATAEYIRSVLTPHQFLFGGIEFKYQPSIRDISHAIGDLSPLVDVFTTSGPATGKAPDVEKTLGLRKRILTNQLAVASGMTPENVESFLDYVDCFLVATGVSTSFHELDPERVKLMASKVHYHK